MRSLAVEARHGEGARHGDRGLVRRVFDDFRAGALDAATAAAHLGGARSRLSRLSGLRTARLREHAGFAPKASGGDRRKDWPPEARRFLVELLLNC